MNAKSTPSKRSNSTFAPWLALAVAVLIILTGGGLYGSYSQRWGPTADLVAAAAQLEKMPRQIGNWILTEDFPMEKSTIEMLECAGYVNRCYVHQETGKAIRLTIIVGPPGPTAVHTPEICYSSRAYEIDGERQMVQLESSPSVRQTFWCVDFKTRNLLAEGLRVYYAWSRGKLWEASDSPRYEFAGAPLLYKIQLSTPSAPGSAPESRDIGREFLNELVKSEWRVAAP